MKAVHLLQVCLLSFCAIVIEASFSGLDKSICKILEQTLSTEKWKIDVIYFENASCANLATRIIKCASKHFPIQVISVKNEKMLNRINGSTVLLFDSAEKFRETASAIQWLSNPHRRQKCIVYAPNLATNDITQSIDDGFEIDKVAFLINETKTSIDLMTSFMFTEQACKKNQLKTINTFDESTSTWTTSNFFPRKYKNMHNCSLTLKTHPALDQKRGMFPCIAKIRNFTVTKVILKAAVYEQLEGADLFIYDRTMETVDNPSYVVSTFYNIFKVFWVLPSGEPYNQFEKMFMMFDDDVWTGIGCTLLLLLISIRIINRLPIKVRNFVFGLGIRTPTMNLLEIFLCGGQNKVPRRNFARFILMPIVLWCLVFRTCYQSKLFEFLQCDLRKARVGSLQDAKDQNFTIMLNMRPVASFEKLHIPFV